MSSELKKALVNGKPWHSIWISCCLVIPNGFDPENPQDPLILEARRVVGDKQEETRRSLNGEILNTTTIFRPFLVHDPLRKYGTVAVKYLLFARSFELHRWSQEGNLKEKSYKKMWLNGRRIRVKRR